MVEAHQNLGASFQSRANLNEAIKHFSEALPLRPDFAEAHYSLGVTFERQGKLGEAIGHYTVVLRIEPSHTQARKKLDALMREADKGKGAVKGITKPRTF